MQKIALLGAGRIGQVHAQAISRNPQVQLVAVADPVAAAASAVAVAHRCEVRTLEAIEQDESIDAVFICTPANTHADFIERFARAGKAMFCEKPIDMDLARVRACLQVVTKNNGRLMVGFNRRFDPHFRAMQQAIRQGRIGQVEMAVITSRDPAPPSHEYLKVSGGIYRDMMIHDFDMARFLMNEEFTTVYAVGAALVDPQIGAIGDLDTASVILTTASGQQVMIGNSRRATYGYDQRIEVHGAKGMLRADNPRPQVVEWSNEQGATLFPLHHFFMTRYIDAYGAEIAAFLESLVSNTPMSPTGEDGLQALVLAEAAVRSQQEKRPINLREI